MAQDDFLFSDHDLRSVLDSQGRKLAEEIDGILAERLLATTAESWGDYCEEKYRINVPRLKRDEVTVDQQEDQVDVSGDPGRHIRNRSRPFHLTGTRFSFFVPFEGQAQVFKCRPSTYTSVLPQAHVRDSELLLSYTELRDADPKAIRARFDHDIGDIQGYLEWIEKDVTPFNASLRGEAIKPVEGRRAKLLKDQNVLGGLGFPVRRRDNAPATYAVPAVRRRPPMANPSATQKGRPPEPGLPTDEYEHILSVISNMVHVMERSPKAFAGMDEEALRQHFLVQLNGQYEGQVTGETFNFEGKTDILIRAGDRNVFIAECKFWRGPDSLREAADQVLRYASWRDTKTAILLFNRGKSLSAALAKVPEVVHAHPNYLKELTIEGETRFRFVLHHRDDRERELILTVLVFEVPG